MNMKQLFPVIALLGIFCAVPRPVLADDDDSGPAVQATVFVKTVHPTEKVLARELTAYGAVMPDARKTVHIVLPRPGRVTKLAVSTGEEVRSGQKLFEFATDSSTVLVYQEAVSSVRFARADLARVQELLKERLATQAQLAISKKALSDAEQTLQAQEKTGAGKATQWSVAPGDAVVTNITASVGERMDRGGGIMELTARGAVQVHLGVEPERLSEVRPGMPVVMTSVFGHNLSVHGRIDEIHAMINPQTRLVDAIVRLDKSAADGLLPGMQVRGIITLSKVKSWVVPRQAVLSDDDGSYVFQVKGGKAIRVKVKTVLDTDDVYGIEGNLDPKLELVVLGNYELSNGQTVRATEVGAPAQADKAGAK